MESVIDTTADAVAWERARLLDRLKVVGEERWRAVEQREIARVARDATVFATARLRSLTQTPYLRAVDRAAARKAIQGRAAHPCRQCGGVHA